jgi:hypothetical protein
MRALLYTVFCRVASKRSAALTESTCIVAVTTTAGAALAVLDGVADAPETDSEKLVRTSFVTVPALVVSDSSATPPLAPAPSDAT